MLEILEIAEVARDVGALLHKLGMSAEWPATRLDMTHFILLAGATPFAPR